MLGRVLDTRSSGRRARHAAAAAARSPSMAQEPLILTEENVIAVLAEVWYFCSPSRPYCCRLDPVPRYPRRKHGNDGSTERSDGRKQPTHRIDTTTVRSPQTPLSSQWCHHLDATYRDATFRAVAKTQSFPHKYQQLGAFLFRRWRSSFSPPPSRDRSRSARQPASNRWSVVASPTSEARGRERNGTK